MRSGTVLPDWASLPAQSGNPKGLPDWAGSLAQSGNTHIQEVNLATPVRGRLTSPIILRSRAMTNHIAEIYFRAWKKATGDFLEKMESVCVQDLMKNAILLHRTSPVHGNVRQVGQGGVSRVEPQSGLNPQCPQTTCRPPRAR